MYRGYFIADAVVHAFNWSRENAAIDYTRDFLMANWEFHVSMSKPDRFRMLETEFVHDWKIEELADLLFVESGIDLAFYHAVEMTDFFKDGHASTPKGIEMASRWPNRARWYCAVNPFEGQKALDDLEQHIVEHGAVGLKIYPARYIDGRTVPVLVDDEKLTFPLIERARSLGVKHVAIHKFMPLGPTTLDPFVPNDLDRAVVAFPDVTFEIVHVGWSMVEDSCLQLSRHPNMIASLEASFAIIVNQPRRFAHYIGEVLRAAGPDRIIYSSGAALFHPTPALDAFIDFKMPDDLIEGYGYPEVDDVTKAKILGLNLARLHDIDVASQQASVATDEFSRQRLERDPAVAWAALRGAAV